METPTNTPTSKCCEKCFCRQGTRAGGGTYCFYDFNGCCHTPTTDSKNSSEGCCGKCSGEFKDECYCPYETCCHTTDTGWETYVKEELKRMFGNGYGSYLIDDSRMSFACLMELIQHIAKEEYERGSQAGYERHRNYINGIIERSPFKDKLRTEIYGAALVTQP